MATLRFANPVLQAVSDNAKDLRRCASEMIANGTDAPTLAAGIFKAKACIEAIAPGMAESSELSAAFNERKEMRRFTVTSQHFPKATSDIEELGEQLVVSWLTIRGALLSTKLRQRLQRDAKDLTPAVTTLASLLCKKPFTVPPHDEKLRSVAGLLERQSPSTTTSGGRAGRPKPAPAAAAAASGSGAGPYGHHDHDDRAHGDFDGASESDTGTGAASAGRSVSARAVAARTAPHSDGFPKSLVWVPFQIKARSPFATGARTTETIESVAWPKSGWKATEAVLAVVDASGAATGIAVDPRHSISATAAQLIGKDVEGMCAAEALTPEEASAMNDALRELLELSKQAVHSDKAGRIAVYGSAATGLAAHGSDVDVVYVGSLRDTAMTGDDVREFLASRAASAGRKPHTRHRTFAAPLPMRWISSWLHSKRNTFPFHVVEEIGFARVPILKLKYIPTGLELDLSFNSVLSVHNSRMIRLYMLCDPGARPHLLTTFIKTWAKARCIKDSSLNTISSYSYTLLVIFFLQQRGILPNLQAPGLIAAFERWRGEKLPALDVNGFSVRYCGDDVFVRSLMEARVAMGGYCHESLGSLVVGFFEYYTRVFDWEQDAVSVRLGRPRPRHTWPHAVPSRIGIEDPFENERDLCITIGGRNQRYPGQIRMFNEMVRAREMLHTALVGIPDASCEKAVAATMKRLIEPPSPQSLKRGKARKAKK